MTHPALAAIKSAIGARPKTDPRQLPVSFGRVVVFDRVGNVIGRLNVPFDQACMKFADLIQGERPDGFGYATLYGWLNQEERLAYLSHNGKIDMNENKLGELLAKFEASKERTPLRDAPKPRAPKTRK